jgi:hypothetical protein
MSSARRVGRDSTVTMVGVIILRTCENQLKKTEEKQISHLPPSLYYTIARIAGHWGCCGSSLWLSLIPRIFGQR